MFLRFPHKTLIFNLHNLSVEETANLPILPIDTGRYGTPEMLKIFDEETRVQKLLDVEAALALAHAEVGNIPKKDAEKIAAMASTKYVKVERVKAIEKEIKHDIASLVRALSEVCGSSGAYVHLGATSYDIVDTANALQLKDALDVIEKRLVDFKVILQKQALMHKETVMIGRTHGQHALPITLGFKFAVWGYEVNRHIERLEECKKRVLVGKVSGAVGTQAGLGEHAEQIQELVMKRLGSYMRLRFPRKLCNETAMPNSFASTRWWLLHLRILQPKSANSNAPKSPNSSNRLKQKNRSAAPLCPTNRTLKPASASAV